MNSFWQFDLAIAADFRNIDTAELPIHGRIPAAQPRTEKICRIEKDRNIPCIETNVSQSNGLFVGNHPMPTKSMKSFGFFAVAILGHCALNLPLHAQNASDQHADHTKAQQANENDLQSQIREMQTKIANLEAALKQNHSAPSGNGKNMAVMSGMQIGDKGMAGMQDKKDMMMKGMGSDKKANMDEMSGMQMGGGGSGQGMGMMGMMDGMQMGGGSGMGSGGMGSSGMGMGMMSKGMSMMGKMKGMDGMSMASSLPGFPGASHIYHVGADGFFLNHAQHIELSADQQAKLNQLKEEQLLKQADFERQLESAEQELWILTSSDSPNAKQIEDKIAEISKLQGEQRFAYIRAIGEAAQALTDDQRKALTGTMEKVDPDNHALHSK